MVHASRVCSAGLKPQVEMLLGEVYKVASRRATHMSKVRSSKQIPVATDENRGKRINRAAFHKGFTGHYSTTSRGSLSRRNARLLLLSAKRCFHSLGRCVCVCVCLPPCACLVRVLQASGTRARLSHLPPSLLTFLGQAASISGCQ